MEKQTRLKKFKGLPHELKGLDYTYDAEVEGEEVSYTPRNSKNEFIFRKKSSNIKELEKQDKLRKNRPEGDRISDISFDAVAKQLMLDESQQLASEGIDPFNTGKEVFAIGGVNTYKGSIPTISDNVSIDNGNTLGFNFNPTSDPSLSNPQRYSNASIMPDGSTSQNWGVNTSQGKGMTAGQIGGYAAAVGGLASSLAQLGPEDPYYSQGVGQKSKGMSVAEGTVDSIVGAIPLVGQFYGAGKGISSAIEVGRDDARSKGNVAGAEAAAFGAGFVDPIGSWFDLAADEKNGILTSGQHVGAGFLNILMPGAGDAYVEKFRRQHVQSQEKQAGYNAILAERGLIPQSNEVVRNRTQEFKNGGMRKKYAGTNGSVRNTVPKDDYIDPALGYPNLTTEHLRGLLPSVTIDGNNSLNASTFNAPQGEFLPTNSNYGLEDIDPSKGYKNLSTGDLLKKSQEDNKKFEFDPNILTSIAGGLGQMAPSIAYLAGDGKDYDRVNYPKYSPKTLSDDVSLRETRDSYAAAREVMRQLGKLDLGALSALAAGESQARSGVRQNIANVNTGIKNDAQLKNIATMIQQMGDEAANKGQYETNKLEEQKNIARAVGLGVRQYNMGSNDEIRKELIKSMTEQKFTELFGEV